MRHTVVVAALASFLFFPAAVQGATIPIGVLNDVAYSTVLNDWGWTVAYRGGFGEFVTLDEVFGTAQPGDYVMLAAIRDNSDTFDVLAAALASDVLTVTEQDQTHQANGAEWYFNTASMGFAGPGDQIFQAEADTLGITERDRLSWHTCFLPAPECGIGHGIFVPDAAVIGLGPGFRSGSTISPINGVDTLDRVVLIARVPEPSTILLLGIAVVCLGKSRVPMRTVLAGALRLRQR